MNTLAKSLTSVAMACLLAASAQAQQGFGVTLYGMVDAFAYSKQLANEKRSSQLVSGPMTTSFWGIRASEDLGGGMVAIADMAGFFQVDTGGSQRSSADAGGFWGKYAWIGLSSATLGSVRLGRQATPTFLNTVRFEPYSGSSAFGTVLHTYVPTGTQPMMTANGSVGTNASGLPAGGDSAWNNALSYSSPVISGFSLQAMVAAPEGAASPAPGKRYSTAFNYVSGPLSLGLSMDKIDKASAVVVRTASDPAGAPYTLTGLNTTSFGGAYDFRVAKVYAQLFSSKLKLGSAADVKLTTTQLGTAVPVLPTGRIIVSWLHTTRAQSAVADKTRNTLSTGFDYDLSKDTDLYAVLMSDRVTGLANGTGYGVGLRHRF